MRFVIFLAVFIVGCSTKSSFEVQSKDGLSDLSSIPQDVRQYSSELDENIVKIKPLIALNDIAITIWNEFNHRGAGKLLLTS